MRFWDSSALLPLLVLEQGTSAMVSLLGADPLMVLWWATSVECHSGMRRRVRDGSLDTPDFLDAERLLHDYAAAAVEIEPRPEVRSKALRMLKDHPLRAADALQLAAAVTGRDALGPLEFVCLDERLRAAAAAEGLTVLP